MSRRRKRTPAEWREIRELQRATLQGLVREHCYENPGTDASWAFLEDGNEEEAAAAAAGVPRRGSAAAAASVRNGLWTEGSSASPAGITGDKVTIGIGLDWQSVTGPIEKRDDLRVYLDGLFGPSKERKRGVVNFNDGGVDWECGAILAWNSGRYLLSLNAVALRSMAEFALKRMLVKLHDVFEARRGSRTDVALDLDPAVVSMQDVRAAANAGHYRGFRRSAEDFRKYRDGTPIGEQVNFGVRENGRTTRLYNKTLESKGKIHATRVEPELHDDHAQTAWHMIVEACRPESAPDALVKLLGRIVGGQIDFVDREGAHRHADRFKRLPWWQKVLDEVGFVKLSTVRTVVSMERKLLWMLHVGKRTVANAESFLESIGVSAAGFLHSWLDLMIEEGRKCVGGEQVEAVVHAFDWRAVFREIASRNETYHRDLVLAGM